MFLLALLSTLVSPPAGDPMSAHTCDLAGVPEILPHDPVVDCTPSTDTGYTSGNAFEITVAHIDGKAAEIDTLNAFWVMRQAAAGDGVDIHVVSGFRTMAEQQYLYDCYQCCCCNNCNLAATPGYSNHQSGHAMDLNSSGTGVYNWLAQNGGTYGFTETVAGEPWHWEWWGGGPGGGICNVTSAPQGSLDVADCSGVSGWAYDPDAPETALTVEVYFGGPKGDPAAVLVTAVADEHREDLCQAIGSCEHAFSVTLPKSLQDGLPHEIHVYAPDTGEDGEAEVGSVDTWSCSPPALPAGIRRLVADPTLATWTFSPALDVYPADAAELAAREAGPDLAASPSLVQAAGEQAVYLLDGPVRRHVPNPAAMAAWHFATGDIVPMDALELAAIPEGTPLWAEPFFADGGDGVVWLLDDAQMFGGTTTDTSAGSDSDSAGTSGATTTAGSAGTTGFDTTGADTTPFPTGYGQDTTGCACQAPRVPAPLSVTLWALLLLPLRRRRF